jgi:hypothetical protein
MKNFRLILLLPVFLLAGMAQAQTADDIIKNYFENTGGLDNWKALNGVKMQVKVSQQGMEFPVEIVQTRSGKQYTKITFQGMVIYQGVFDGTTLWNTNFMTMQAEKADAEATANYLLDINDFPDPFIDYKAKKYTVELVGKEIIDGTETFKIKLVKEPRTVDGQKVDDITYYYFDVDSFVPIAQESEVKEGPNKGVIGRITFSDYQEVNGLYFAFSLSQGIKDGPSQPLTITSIELNPTIDEDVVKYKGN